MQEIGKGTPLGRILGAGTATAAKVLGVTRAPVVKGQSMPAYEPRAVKGIGMIYATSTMGADHTAGLHHRPRDPGRRRQGGPVRQRTRPTWPAASWTPRPSSTRSGHCLFIAFAILDIASGFEGVVEECNGVLGTNWTDGRRGPHRQGDPAPRSGPLTRRRASQRRRPHARVHEVRDAAAAQRPLGRARRGVGRRLGRLAGTCRALRQGAG